MTPLPDRSVSVIVVAAGVGRRMGASVHKAWLPLAGIPVVEHTLRRFEGLPFVRQTLLVVHPDDLDRGGELAGRMPGLRVIAGGEHRVDSVRAGLDAADENAALIAVQDGVRPLVDRALVERVCRAALSTGAAIAGIPLHGTIKEVEVGEAAGDIVGRIVRTVSRERLYEAQTPQVFRAEILRRAYREFTDMTITDDAQAVARLGVEVALVAGSTHNLKITTPEDLQAAERLLSSE